MTQTIKITDSETKITRCSADGLSPAQREAVDAPLPTIVLSAAGTGKTKTLIHRVEKAHGEDGLSLDSIFVTTFTRKAAQEMTARMQKLMGSAPEFTGTFHRNALILMKKFSVLLEAHGYDPNIQLLDASDRGKILSELLRPWDGELKRLSISKTNAKKWMREGIDSLKGRGLYPIDYANAPAKVKQFNIKTLTEKFDELPAEIAYDVYRRYQEELRHMNLLDFDDVMALPVFAMREEGTRQRVSSCFRLVVVDEFQDCSALQFEMAEQLSSDGKYLYLVGDEDQLIYGWRDANLQKVMEYYDAPDFAIRYLEENYRSDANIVHLANAVIQKNRMRSAKSMRPVKPAKKKVLHLQPYDTRQEAQYVVKRIQKLIRKGVTPGEIAILYRANSYSTVLEAELIKQGIDYDVAKAYNFFEYQEIKNVVAYLRLANDPGDEHSFRRIFNWPRRKNGEAALRKLEVEAYTKKLSLFQALKRQEKKSPANVAFVGLVEKLSALMRMDVPVKALMDTLIKGLDIELVLFHEHGIKEGEERMERVRKLALILDILKEEYDNYPDTLRKLNDEMATLNKEPKERKVQLMTAHASKGLEFGHLFVVGAVNGMFPSLHGEPEGQGGDTLWINTNLEEERRLFYVALTWAKERLTILSPKYIHRFGSVSEYERTMFLNGLEGMCKVKAVGV